MIATIGKHDSSDVQLDIEKLIDTRMLVCANSGGGKSWLMRLLVEQVAANIPTIVFDPEGEFYTLREKLDMVLVGRDGEVPADIRTAKALASKIMELRLSAVIDLSDLKRTDKQLYVKKFIDSIMSLPRRLWGTTLFAIDEAQGFCPQLNPKSCASSDSIIALMSQGRKRGFGTLLATQRLSRISKDACAEANNIIIGRTAQDVDLVRAGDILDLDKHTRLQLRNLNPGEFYGFGPAFPYQDKILFKAGAVLTSHPRAGYRHELKAPGASKAIQKVVASLSEIAERSADDVYDLDAAKARIAELHREVKRAEVKANKIASSDTKAFDVDGAVNCALTRQQKEYTKESRVFETRIRSLTTTIEKIGKLCGIPAPIQVDMSGICAEDLINPKPGTVLKAVRKTTPTATSDNTDLGKCAKAIVAALGPYPDGRSKRQIGLLSGYSHGSGGFSNSLSQLRSAGYLEGNSNCLTLTFEGDVELGPFDPAPTGEAMREHWAEKVKGSKFGGKCAGQILDVLLEAYPDRLSKEEIAARTPEQYSPTSGGFSNSISKLKTLDLIEGDASSGLKAVDDFFE